MFFSYFFVLRARWNVWNSVIEAGGMISLKTIRKLSTGEKISISYGVHYRRDNKLKRQIFLQKRAVECNCVHCLSDTSVEHMVRRVIRVISYTVSLI